MKTTVVIGQGYVGLPLAKEAALAGQKVFGLDLSSKVVNLLNAGVSHIDDITDEEIATMLSSGYRATSDTKMLKEADYIIICVPTPLGDDGSPDLTAVVGASDSISEHMTPGTTVILESTTYPGTTQELILPILNKSGLILDKEFWLAFSPERIDPGNPTYTLRNTPKVVGGVTPISTRKAVEFYDLIVEQTVPVRSSKEAETAKLLENTYRHINIALVNEMAKFCHEMEIDLWDVINAAKTKPFGFEAFYPGPGVGGHCIPIDPNYLSYEVKKQLGYPFRFVELAQEINNSMPRYIVARCQDILNEDKISLNGSKILLLGVTYKQNISDQRESPASEVASLLYQKGATISYSDPLVPRWSFGEKEYQSEPNYLHIAEESDLVILLQAHTEFDLSALEKLDVNVFDTRGKLHGSRTVRL